MREKQSEGRSRIMFLEYLRVFAFIAVFLSHKFEAGSHIETSSSRLFLQGAVTIYNSTMAMLWNGQAGVIIFFLISGYIIAAKAIEESWSTFAIKRIFRIYPLFVVCMLASMFLDMHVRDYPPSPYPLWQHASLLGDFFGTGLSVGGVEWTLRIEMLFYVFAGFVAFLKIPRNRFALSAVLLLSMVAVIAGPRFPSWSPDTSGNLNAFFPFLLVGMAAYYFEAKMVPLVVLIATVIMALGISKFWSMPVVMVGVFFIMWSTSRHITYNRFFASVASITYSFYLIHDWLYDICQIELARVTDSMITRAIVSTLIVLAASILATKFIEKPFIRLGNRLCRWNVPALKTAP